MDALLLSRIQFGFTIGFHILFPTFTIGLAWYLVYFEAAWRRTKQAHYLELYFFWVKIFALTFGMGVVSGLVLSYELGTNFARFAHFAGPVMGPLLSVEVLTAFFVEAGFLGIMLFGWRKVGPGLHFAATVLVALGTTNSAFWILAANSFMHTPQGATVVDGQLVPVDWLAIVFNPSFPYRLAHMLLASFIASSLVIAGVSAWYLRRGRHLDDARTGLKSALLALAVLTPAQIVVGDLHGLNVATHQPVKLAAIEGLWETGRGVPLVAFGWPDAQAEENHWEIAIPKLGSIILTHELDGEVRGLKEVPPQDRPPLPAVFFGFRLMVGLGLWFLLLAALGVVQWKRGRLESSPRLLKAYTLSIPLGFVATLAGWIVAETGRQPWVIHGLMRTADAASPVPAQAVATSLAMFVVVYGILLAAYLFFAWTLVAKGPAPPPAKHPKAIRGARPATVLPGKPQETH